MIGVEEVAHADGDRGLVIGEFVYGLQVEAEVLVYVLGSEWVCRIGGDDGIYEVEVAGEV